MFLRILSLHASESTMRNPCEGWAQHKWNEERGAWLRLKDFPHAAFQDASTESHLLWCRRPAPEPLKRVEPCHSPWGLLDCLSHLAQVIPPSFPLTSSLWKPRINKFRYLTELPLRSPSLLLRCPSGDCQAVLSQPDSKTSPGKAHQKTSALEV